MRAHNPTRLLKDVGRRVAELRRGRGMTQEQLAERLGVSVRQVQRIEAGQQNLTVRSLAELGTILKAEVPDFFTPPSTLRKSGRPRKQSSA